MPDEQQRDSDDAVLARLINETPGLKGVFERSISNRVDEVCQRREIIYQVKGMLCLIYGLNSDRAFELLRWRSQETNTKLRVFAEQVYAEFCALQTEEGLPERDVLDGIFMTAHTRIAAE